MSFRDEISAGHAACRKCLYYHKESDTAGHCRYHPPVVVVNPEVGARSVFPQVKADNWCGKYEVAGRYEIELRGE